MTLSMPSSATPKYRYEYEVVQGGKVVRTGVAWANSVDQAWEACNDASWLSREGFSVLSRTDTATGKRIAPWDPEWSHD